jgi:exoribonuclease R
MPNLKPRKYDLKAIAKSVLQQHGLHPNFPPDVLLQVSRTRELQKEEAGEVRDLSHLPWCSIDNDDSRDLDQLSASEDLGNGKVRLFVAVADVDALVPMHCPVDQHAAKNTTSIYTGLVMFPMIPERFSCDLTSLNENEERAAIVVEMVVDAEGAFPTRRCTGDGSATRPSSLITRSRLGWRGSGRSRPPRPMCRAWMSRSRCRTGPPRRSA